MNIEKSYDSWSQQYDSNENKTRDLDRIATIETLSKYEFDNVIELGCGTGKNTEWLLNRARKIIGIDFSGEMLNIAKTKIRDKRIKFIRADLTEAWEVEDEFADLITCSLTLEHIKDLGHIFNQGYRKLKEKGHFFICELHPFRQYQGSKARFYTEDGIEELEVYTHHFSEYTGSALSSGLKIIEVNEWYDDPAKHEIPRLVSFVFRK